MKRFLKSVLVCVLIVPMVVMLAACGGTKTLDGRTYVFSKVEVDGTVVKEDVETSYIYTSFSFEDGVLSLVDGTAEAITFDYKVENNRIYTKSSSSTEYSSTSFAEVSGKYLIVTEKTDEGTAKIYFKKK